MVELNQSLVPTPCLPWRAAKIPPHRQVRKLQHLEHENGLRDGRLPPVEISLMGISLMRLQSATPLAEEAATSAAASAASSASAASAAAAAAAVTTTTAAAVTTTTAATA